MCFANTGHKKSFSWRARQSRARRAHRRAALLAPLEGAAPANTSWACFRKEGGEAACWVTESQALLTQATRHPGSVLTERRGRLLPPSAPGLFWPKQGKGLAQKLP